MISSSKVVNRANSVAVAITLLLSVVAGTTVTGPARAQNMNMPGMSAGKPAAATSATALGTVESVNIPQRRIKLNHEAIPEVNWPAMSMEFPTASEVDLSRVKPGIKVKFTLSGADGSYTVQSISPAP